MVNEQAAVMTVVRMTLRETGGVERSGSSQSRSRALSSTVRGFEQWIAKVGAV